VYRVPERHGGSDDEKDDNHDPTQRCVLVRRRAQCSAVVHDHRHPLCTSQVVGARPVPDHPALHPEAAPDAEDDEDDDGGNQHPGVQPSQHAEEQARAHTHRHASSDATAPPHEGRHHDHPVIVTAPRPRHGKKPNGLDRAVQ